MDSKNRTVTQIHSCLADMYYQLLALSGVHVHCAAATCVFIKIYSIAFDIQIHVHAFQDTRTCISDFVKCGIKRSFVRSATRHVRQQRTIYRKC